MTEQQVISQEIWNEFESEINKVIDFDISKLELSPEDSIVLDGFFKKFLDPAEEFPPGSRHTIIEKNFAIYIIKNKLPLEQIKEAYKAKGFNIQSLISQIKGVSSGTYKGNVSIGELVNWCKENRPDLAEMFKDISGLDESKIMRRSDLIFPTQHLPLYPLIDSATQIFGKEYIHIKKLLHHHLISSALPEHLMIAKKGSIEIDLRDYLFLAWATGQAKGNINNFVTNINQLIGRNVAHLMSFHEEQLVGRTIKRKITDPGNPKKKKEVYIANPGHFSVDTIIIDECKHLLTDRDKEPSRNYLLKGMDKYLQNRIFKRMTENLNNPEETLSYYPKFNALFGTQPFNFHEETLVLNGFLKRVTTDYLPLIDREDTYFESRLESNNDTALKNQELAYLLKEVRDCKDEEWTFSEDFNQIFKECFGILRHVGLYNNKKKRNYTRLIEWQLQDRLLRKSCLYAIARTKKAHVTAVDVEMAFVELLEDFVVELEFINDKIYGDLDYGSVWGTSDKKEESVLRYLYQYGAISEEESTISIKELQNEIRQIYHLGEEGARKVYYKIMSKDLIKSRPLGKSGSKVWLIKIPEVNKGGKTGKGGIDVKSKYKELCGKTGNVVKGGSND